MQSWAVLELALLVLVFVASAVLAVPVVIRKPFRREMRSHPALAVGLGVAGAVAFAAAVGLGSRSAPARRTMAIGLGLGALAALIRARPGYGRARGLPMGSLGVAKSLDAIDDPEFYAREAQRWGHVFKMSQFHRPVVCITELKTGLDFIQANDEALMQSDWSFNRLVPGGYLEYMNGEMHTRYREAFAPAFSREAVEASRGTMTEVAREQLHAMAQDSLPDGVHPEPYLLPIPQTSLLRVVLGIERGHEHFDELASYFADLNRPMELFLPAPRSSQETYRWLATKVVELSADGGSRVASPSVLADLMSADPNAARDETVVGNLVLMVKEGSIMVRGMLRWIVKMLADHPERAAEIRSAAGDAVRMESLTTDFVRETIRLYESPYVYRSVVRDVRLGPYRIPKGWLVRLCLTEAHSNREAFHQPARFDPERTAAAGSDASVFCPFGHGRHACLGADVAIEIAKVVVREAAVGYDMRSRNDGPAWRINRHWGLWRPSRRLRITLEPREPGSAS